MAVWVTSSQRGSSVSGNKMKPAPRAKSRPGFKSGKGYAAKPKNTTTNTPTSGAGAPAPSAAGGVLGRPVDPFHDAAVNAAQRNYAQSMQYSQFQQGQLGSVFGLGMRPDGGIYDDPSNPFSRAAAIQAAYTNQQRGNRNSAAARGQFYAGSLQNAQDESTRQHLENRDRLVREFMSAQAAIQQQQLQAGNAYADELTAADEASINRALAERPDPASVPGAPAAFAPKSGFKFVMNSGPRAGQSYNLVPGKGPNKGKLVRQYEDGFREAR